MKNLVNDCPVCFSSEEKQIDADKNRTFHQCLNCGLIFVPRSQLISSENEFKRYQQHENAAEDAGYLMYLTQIQKDCAKYLTTGEVGLDFGCGASQILGELFATGGFPTTSYDLYFHPDKSYQTKKFDFIILSEVIEHLRNPIEVMQELKSLLKAQGKIFIKTKYYPDLTQFSKWFYKRDVTHVQFFNPQSMLFLSTELNMKYADSIGPDLYLLNEA